MLEKSSLKCKNDKTHFYTGYNSIKLEIAKLLEW